MGFFKFIKSKKEKEKEKEKSVTAKPKNVTPVKSVRKPSAVQKSKQKPSPPVAESTEKDKEIVMDESYLDITIDEADLDMEIVDLNKRQHYRINRGQILDDDIKVYCINIVTGKSSNDLMLDISPGGLLLLSNSSHKVGDKLRVSCNIGLNFRMKEVVRVVMVKGRKCGTEFVNPSEQTTTFLTELYGAMRLNR